MEVVIRECNGHIASLRLSCDFLFVHYSNAVAPVEDEVLDYYLSAFSSINRHAVLEVGIQHLPVAIFNHFSPSVWSAIVHVVC